MSLTKNIKLKAAIFLILSILFLVFGFNHTVKADTNSDVHRIYIDNPQNNATVGLGNTIAVNGWSLNSSGVKEVDVYVDGNYAGNATIGQARPDVNKVFPGYKDGANSGYSYNLDTSKLSSGSHTVIVKSIGNNGSSVTESKKINIKNLAPGIYIDNPQNNATVGAGNTIAVNGWSLNSSGVKEVAVYVDGNHTGNATIGQARPDVNKVFPGYKDGANSGYSYNLDTSKLSSGSHTVIVKSIGNNGSSITESKKINIKNLAPRIYIDSPQNNATVGAGNTIAVNGWSLNSSGVKQVAVYVDGNYAGNATIGQARPDVNKIFPGYSGGANSGYSYNLDMSKLSNGQHTIVVKSIGNDGSTISQSIIININKSVTKTIAVAIDIGHNAPYDSGATGLKQEDEITMAVGQKVISKLQAKGYNVISTKPATATSTTDSLQQRVDAANNGNAELFISIHANVGGGEGTEVWAGGSQKSIDLANNILKNMVALGYKDRGVKVQGQNGYQHLYVLNNTNMPAVLVETFFLDSQSDMNKYNPESIANAVVKGIISTLN